jgi:hypothetical protein
VKKRARTISLVVKQLLSAAERVGVVYCPDHYRLAQLHGFMAIRWRRIVHDGCSLSSNLLFLPSRQTHIIAFLDRFNWMREEEEEKTLQINIRQWAKEEL